MLKLVLLVFGIMLVVITKSQTSIVYIDGSNNKYTITKDKVDFVAVKKEQSSSGIYSGGENTSKRIKPKQFTKINSLILNIETDSINHVSDRLMGCGTLYKANSKTPIYIAMNSLSKNNFESYLKKMLEY
ncbi:MAG: hypothetical protein HY951_08515 [Bacteroidia bacterium]|nr:hypothetical protein [Bacteroidia bacterium]